MRFAFIFLTALLLWLGTPVAQAVDIDFEAAPHNYGKRTPQDRFTKLIADLESDRLGLNKTSEREALIALLKTLDIPASSQLLVFSTTSLQLSRISPSNPRALYFSEDLYLGYVPGGRIEVVSLDPELGGIFYIFDLPQENRPLRVERSNRCMNCHAGEETRFLPGLLVKSVVPGPTGGSLMAFRQDDMGHAVPLNQRHGGWYVTGDGGMTNHWGNLIGRLSSSELSKQPVLPGQRFDFERYPVNTSDLLAHLIHEHQVGFVNRVIEASYTARTYLHLNDGRLTEEHTAALDEQARMLTRYLLFADEAPLPPGGIVGDSQFRIDFLRNKRASATGKSLKDLDLQTRLFKHRCSYMIYSTPFQGLPRSMKERLFRNLKAALNIEKPAPGFDYIPPVEKQAILAILNETLPEFAD